MCGRSVARGRVGVSSERSFGPFGLDAERMSPGARVAAALSVLVPVALSGVFLVVFVPGLWWIFTTYFWIAFPAFGLLSSGLNGLSASRPVRVSSQAKERELLEVLSELGEVSAVRAAAETSLAITEADGMLKGLSEAGHLEVRVRGGAILYALWDEQSSIDGAA